LTAVRAKEAKPLEISFGFKETATTNLVLHLSDAEDPLSLFNII
jgi:hypothetical protein